MLVKSDEEMRELGTTACEIQDAYGRLDRFHTERHGENVSLA
jgi:hypothetical protein